MTTYLLNTLLCSAGLLLFYRRHYATAVMHRFKRWYLLLALPVSLLIPALYFPAQELPAYIPEPIGLGPDPQSDPVFRSGQGTDGWTVALAVWATVSALLLVRFIYNLVSIIRRRRRGEAHHLFGIDVVLTDEPVAPHSFGKWMFLHRADCQGLQVPSEIFIHERGHIRARHTVDVVLMELLQALWWFNPLLPLYRKEVQLNHEYEADAAVLAERPRTAYQELLLRWSSKNIPLTSSIHYSPLKRRFQMMQQQTSHAARRIKMLGLVPMLFFSLFLFSNRMEAQTAPPEKSKTKVVKDLKEEAPKVLVVQGRPLPKESPTQAELTQWLDAKMYGVWIDGQRVDNSKLQGYKPEDFSQVFISRLRKNAINYGKHYYQVDLMTNAYYANQRKEIEEVD